MSLALFEEERAVFEQLAKMKYNGGTGVSTVIRIEALAAAKNELARLTKEKKNAPTS